MIGQFISAGYQIKLYGLKMNLLLLSQRVDLEVKGGRGTTTFSSQPLH